MKLTAILITAACLQISAAGFSQNITISGNNIKLEKVLSSIEKQSGYFFLYKYKEVKNADPVNLKLESVPLHAALAKIFSGQSFTYTIEDKTIIISRRDIFSMDLPVPAIVVRGKVVDEKGQPLPGASVRLKDASNSTVTDVNGEFVFRNLNANDVLVVSFIGFFSSEVTITDQTSIQVVLKEDLKGLNEVIVVGYGTQKKVNLTGAVSVISVDDLATRPVGQTSAGLQGLAAGVTVVQRSGQPGEDAGTIRIRGVGTLGDSNPLVLVDGVEGSMNNIDPNAIESISILKDAASASIYGSRAANGVVLVTTKRAKSDQFSVNYTTYAGWQDPTNMPKMANAVDHMLLTNEAYVNTGRAPFYSQALIDKYRTEGAANRDLYPDTDWQKEVLTNQGFQQSHFVSMNAGTDKIRTLASAGYFDQNGIIETSNFKRFSIRSNTDIKMSDKLAAKIDLQFINAVGLEPGRGSANVFHWMNRIPANQYGINTDGTWGEGWNGDNPIAFSNDGGTNKETQRSSILNFSLNYKPLTWLTAEVNIAPILSEAVGKQFNKFVQTYKADGTLSNYRSPIKSALSETSNRAIRNNMRATLTFEKDLASHNFKLLTGVSRENFRNDYVSAFRDGFILPEYTVLGAGETINQKANGNSAEWALQSVFGRLNYDYKGKYLLEANARYDGSSRFGAGNQYGFFPSVSAGWRVSEEEFMKPLASVISNFKIRASWGQLGNQNIGNYPFASTIDFGATPIGKQIVNVGALNYMANPDISWETTEMTNVGVDVSLFSNLSVTADYYNRHTRGILLALDIPLIIGLGAPFQNVGVVNNKGWELGLDYRGSVNDLRYNIGFNVSDVKNRIVDIRGVKADGLTVNHEGSPINSIYGLQTEGYFKDDAEVASHATQYGKVRAGDLKYKDQNNDGMITDADKIIIGSTVPRFTFGSTLGGSYKGFSISALIQGVGKADGYLYRHGIMPFFEGGTVQEQHKDSWRPDNQNSAFPRLAFSEVNNEKISDFWLKDASYVRLKNLQIAYDLPVSVIKKSGLKSLRVYINGQNMFTKDNFWNGYDVESPVGIGNTYPQVKVYSFGLNTNF